jgi:tRNA pseudouridine55 synthase
MVRVRAKDADLHGVLVVDKPVGPTSHDVVMQLRRTLGTRAIGHAGTLDPAASGVLVIAVGQATKLVSYLTAHAKRYEAKITLGTSTTTLDREGDVIDSAPIPADLAQELADPNESAARPLLARAFEMERIRTEQVPPMFSALKQNGRSLHERARRGEIVELPPRAVEVVSLAWRPASANTIDVELCVSKGYYVRALARDVGTTLGVPAHLSALRRAASGPFTLDEALPADATHETLIGALAPLATAAGRALPIARLSDEGADRARKGQVLATLHFISAPPPGFSAWLDPRGELVAVGRGPAPGNALDADRFVVERGFSQSTSSAVT